MSFFLLLLFVIIISSFHFCYSFETSDGQKREEHGELRHVGSEQEGIAVHGSYSYVVDGVTFTVNYVADENGFQPDGAHLPRV